MQCRPPAFGAADRHACLPRLNIWLPPPAMHAARRRRVLWTYRPSGRWDVRVGAVAGAAYLPHSLTPHDQRCAAVAANANTRPPLTDAAVRSWCDAVPGPSTAGLCTRGCAHRCAQPGPVHRLGYRVAVALGRLAERPSTVRRDWAHRSHICAGTGLTAPTYVPGLGSPLPHLRRDWAHRSHICTGTGPTHRADVESVRRRERERDGDARGCELDGDGNGLSICSRHTRCTASRAEYYITT